jgi:hypothetical protein
MILLLIISACSSLKLEIFFENPVPMLLSHLTWLSKREWLGQIFVPLVHVINSSLISSIIASAAGMFFSVF